MFNFLKQKKEDEKETEFQSTAPKQPIRKEREGKENKKDNLAIIALENYHDRAIKVNCHLNEIRGERNKNYLLGARSVKFNNGEGKVKIEDSVRGKDVFLISDISNYSITYNMYGYENHMSPDEHFQDIIRLISAMAGKAAKITVIMPLLYQSRQHRRQGRESLDCAMALRELESLGVDSVITFDAHDPNIQNVTPYSSFDTIFPMYPILKIFINENKQEINRDSMVVISPDNGAMARAITYASILQLDVGMFYKRRDYTKVINGKNPILAHEYTGPDVEGKNVLIVDDMIASGESLIDVIQEMKSRGAKDVTAICTFAFFTEGLDKFDVLYQEGTIKAVYCTNASYVSPEMMACKWLHIVEMDKFIAKIIHTLHNNESLSPLISSNEKIKTLLSKNDLIK